MKRYTFVAISLFIFGCSEEQVAPEDDTVHLAGFVANPTGGIVASYWKDGEYNALADAAVSSQVSSLYVDGSSVLIGGSKEIAGAMDPALIWVNGIESIIEGVAPNPMIALHDNNLSGVWLEWNTGWVFSKNATSQAIKDTAYDFAPMAMTIHGDDIFISGYSSGSPEPPTFSPPQRAQCWRNGELIFREDEISNALSIFIHEDDVYMAGHLYTPGESNGIACYWKNGERVDLTVDNVNAVARSVFVTDKHVYVAGMIEDQAVYWKDGDVIALTTSGTSSMANSIFVQGADVHVAGYAHGYPAYWKNDVRQEIANQDKLGQVRFLVVGSN